MQASSQQEVEVGLLHRVVIEVHRRLCGTKGDLFLFGTYVGEGEATTEVVHMVVEVIDHKRYLGIVELYAVLGHQQTCIRLKGRSFRLRSLLRIQYFKTAFHMLGIHIEVDDTTHIETLFGIAGKIVAIYLRKIDTAYQPAMKGKVFIEVGLLCQRTFGCYKRQQQSRYSHDSPHCTYMAPARYYTQMLI